MLYNDLKYYWSIKNELKKNPNTQYTTTELFKFGLTCSRLELIEDAKIALQSIKSKSPTAIITMVKLLINDYTPSIWKVDRPKDQIKLLYKMYCNFKINQDSYEVYFDIYGCNNYKDPFFNYIIELCKIHGLDLVQLWILQSTISNEERRFMEDLMKYVSKIQI
eukprot:NODE_15_length_42055_cov_0.634117.p19 type:complete len:164 gc:universal NODE_15_length_42055_cov_0.634117:1065-574(-)